MKIVEEKEQKFMFISFCFGLWSIYIIYKYTIENLQGMYLHVL